MRFNSVLSKISIAVLLTAAGLGCGKLADKAPTDRTLLPGQDIGCFDTLGDRVRRFLSGEIEEAEWVSTFQCVDDQVDFFRKYVRGSVESGYSPNDIGILIRKFLILSHPVSDAFVNSLFELKASAFGGATSVISFSDMDEFLHMNAVLRRESLLLLPYLRERHANPTSKNLLDLSDGWAVFGGHLADYLNGLHGSIDVRKESFLPFIRELLTLNGGDAELVDKYGDFARNLKVIVAGGSADSIEKGAWSVLVREGASLGALYYAFRNGSSDLFLISDDEDGFRIDLSRRLETVIRRIIALHGPGIPLELFDPVIDLAPADALSPEKRAALKTDLRPLVARGLKGKVPGSLDGEAIGNAIAFFTDGLRSQIHLKRIFLNLGATPTVDQFTAAAEKYRSKLDAAGRAEVRYLIEVANRFVGLFPEESGAMRFTEEVRSTRSLNHLLRMTWYRKGMDYLLSVFASGPTTAGHRSAQQSDLATLVADYVHILEAWKLSDPAQTPTELSAKRFREANLFTPISNGDAYMGDDEGTYYIAFLFSSSGLSGRIFNTIVNDWRSCPIIGKDELGSDAMEAACFRRAYFEHPEVFWTQFPGLQTAYAKLSSSEKSAVMLSMEQASRKDGASELPIGPYDIDSFAALPHYVEDVMIRFDEDMNQVLDRHEILDVAFPIFKETLSAYSKSEGIQKAILTYIIYYGEAPPSTAKLLLWWAKMKFAKIEATRSDLYRVVAVLAAKPKPMGP